MCIGPCPPEDESYQITPLSAAGLLRNGGQTLDVVGVGGVSRPFIVLLEAKSQRPDSLGLSTGH